VAIHQDVLVVNGRVEKIGPHTKESSRGDGNSKSSADKKLKIMDGTGLVLMPAGVDAQVHLRVPGQPQKETPFTGLFAAVAGGYGAILTMPNTNPVLDNPETLKLAQNQMADAEELTGVKVLYSAALSVGQNGEQLVDIETLANMGIAAFTDDGKGIESDLLMKRGFERVARTGLPFLQHAEMPGHGGVLAPSSVQQQLQAPAYPADAEVEMVRRDIELLQNIPDARYHVLHVSSKDTVKLIAMAKEAGLKVSGEVSPHHLFFTGDDISPSDPAFKMNPPLRSKEDREELVAALQRGDLDFVATDHAPHEATAKQKGFLAAPFGTTGMETALRVLINLYQQKKLTAERLVQVFSTRPAEFLKIDNEYGSLAAGRSFQAVLVDVEAKPTPIGDRNFESLSTNNCFRGQLLAGEIKCVFLGSHIWQTGSAPSA